MISGLVDADLGGGLYKKRIALPGRGKRAGARTIVASCVNDKWFFLFAFAKNEKDNISKDEKSTFQVIASSLFALDDKALEKAVSDKKLVEVVSMKKQSRIMTEMFEFADGLNQSGLISKDNFLEIQALCKSSVEEITPVEIKMLRNSW
jgi:hypothetical protein